MKVVSIYKVIPRESAATETEEGCLSFEEEVLRDVELSKNAGITNQYSSTFHVSPASIIERLFSTTDIIMMPHRRHMDPWSLKLLIMLRSNKDMWVCGTLQAIINGRRELNRDAAIARSSASKRQREEDGEMEENIDFTDA